MKRLEQFFIDIQKNLLNNDIFHLFNSVNYLTDEKAGLFEEIQKINCFVFWNQFYLLKSFVENKHFSKLEKVEIDFLKDNVIKLILIFNTEKNNHCFFKDAE